MGIARLAKGGFAGCGCAVFLAALVFLASLFFTVLDWLPTETLRCTETTALGGYFGLQFIGMISCVAASNLEPRVYPVAADDALKHADPTNHNPHVQTPPLAYVNYTC